MYRIDFGYSNNNDRILNEGLLDLRKVEGCMVRDGFCGGERDGEELVAEGEGRKMEKRKGVEIRFVMERKGEK
ncbi:hypothetical protein Tco_1087309 [Tanacetum coccineum]